MVKFEAAIKQVMARTFFVFFVIAFLFSPVAHGHVKGCAKTNGRQYLKRPFSMAKFIQQPNDEISLQFKTQNPNGLFLYFKAGPTSYILLKLNNGKVVFKADFGAGNVTATVPSPNLDDYAWHSVRVKRIWKYVNVSVDAFPRASVVIPLNVTLVRLIPRNVMMDTALYIFGGPSDIRYSVPFHGIVNNLVINKMKPIVSYAQNDPKYTLHGYGKLSKHSCYPDV